LALIFCFPYFKVRRKGRSMFTATITSKGQITIPVDVRQALGLDAGDQISFEEIAPGKFSFAPVEKKSVKSIKGMFGSAKKSATIEEMNAVIAMRGASAK
jgi:antitoxin PrlF